MAIKMSTPANLFPGLNDIVDVIEEFPLEVARYMTLLREIDAKCVHTVPELNAQIGRFLAGSRQPGSPQLQTINRLFQDLMPSLEEKMHVSSIAFETLDRLVARVELAYEVALKNQEIPDKLRLGNDNHPAMHLHHELMKKIESKQQSKSQQALRSESRREAMAAKKMHVDPPAPAPASYAPLPLPPAALAAKRRADLPPPARKRKKPRDDYSARPKTNEYGEALYCYCNQVAYGEMVGCDGENCQLEWFHLPCINLETLPKGKWYCDDCKR